MGIAELMNRLSTSPSAAHDDDASSSSHVSPRSHGSASTPRSAAAGRPRRRLFGSGEVHIPPVEEEGEDGEEGATVRKVASGNQRADADADPGHPLFNQTSNQSEKGLAALRKVLSSFASRDKDEEEDVERTVPVLIPPNYKRSFAPRRFEYSTAFGKADWAKELVAVADNGVREELKDMFSIFADMERRPTMLTSDDIALLVEWFRTFLASLQELFYLEEECLFAWIDGTDMLSTEMRKWGNGVKNGRVRGALSAAKRMRRKGEIVRMGNQILACQRLFERRPIAECLPMLAEIVSPFVDELVAYLDLKRDTLPPIIELHMQPKDRVRFERAYWEMARAQPTHETTVVLATRWMDRRQIRKWKSKYFGPKKGAFGRWKDAFMDEHQGIVLEFANRVTICEEERMKQMQESENARAMAQLAIQKMPPLPEYTDSDAQSALSSCASSFRNSNLSSSVILPPTCV